MTLLRVEVHAPNEHADTAVELLAASPNAINRVRIRGALVQPPGDIVACDVPREDADALIEALTQSGLEDGACSVSVQPTLAHLSVGADRAERDARGAASDAVVWQLVRDQLDEERSPSWSFIAFMVLATLLGAIGVITNSAILVVGAMVLGPEFGPLANMIVGVIDRDARRVRDGVASIFVGFGAAIVAASLFVLAMRAAGVFDSRLAFTGIVAEVASPGVLSIVIALIAGVAGTLAITSNRSGTLIGVLISVTTIPAAADAATLLAYGDQRAALDSMITLTINLGGMAVAGVCSLALHLRLTRR